MYSPPHATCGQSSVPVYPPSIGGTFSGMTHLLCESCDTKLQSVLFLVLLLVVLCIAVLSLFPSCVAGDGICPICAQTQGATQALRRVRHEPKGQQVAWWQPETDAVWQFLELADQRGQFPRAKTDRAPSEWSTAGRAQGSGRETRQGDGKSWTDSAKSGSLRGTQSLNEKQKRREAKLTAVYSHAIYSSLMPVC